MKVRDAFGFLSIVALGVAIPVGMASAAGSKVDTYTAGVLNDAANTTPFVIGKSVSNVFTTTDTGSKVVIKTSNKVGDGGAFIQLILNGVDCANYAGKDDTGNDSSKPAKCGVGKHGVNLATPVTDHVLELDTTALGSTSSEVGVPYNVDKGIASFVGTGKNKISAGVAFAGLTAAVAGDPVFVDKIRLHAALWTCTNGSNNLCAVPTDCTSPETCNNGLCGHVCSKDTDCAPNTCTTGQETTACAGPHISPDIGSGCFGGGTYAGAGFTDSIIQ